MSSANPENPKGEMKQDVESGKISSNAVQSKTGVDSTPAASVGSASSKKAALMEGSTNTTTKKTSVNFLRYKKEPSVRTGEDVIMSLKWVIFPDNK